MNLHAQVHVLFKIIITLKPIFDYFFFTSVETEHCVFSLYIKRSSSHLGKIQMIYKLNVGSKIIKIKEWKKTQSCFYLRSLQYNFKYSIHSINDDDQWNLNINIIKITDKLFTVEWYSTTLSLYLNKMHNPINISIQATCNIYSASHFSPSLLIWGKAGY